MPKFLSTFFRHPIATGAIAPSSRHLAEEMVNWIDWASVRTCVEFGPGTGAFTPSILNSLQPGARFLAVELNPQFAEIMRVKLPEVETVCRSVADIEPICAERGVAQIDCIVCGLPWAAFAPDLQQSLMNAVLARLRLAAISAHSPICKVRCCRRACGSNDSCASRFPASNAAERCGGTCPRLLCISAGQRPLETCAPGYSAAGSPLNRTAPERTSYMAPMIFTCPARTN